MHQISDVLKWPTVADLFSRIATRSDVWGTDDHPTTAQNNAKSGGSALAVGAGVHSFKAAGRTAAAQAERAAAVGLPTAPDGNHGDNR